ncbi:MAG: FG-GAP repeat protein, partial [Microthrixaceae bacterium]|nr:FG-GAP repeat protein [Microthrixaceae bacterium]
MGAYEVGRVRVRMPWAGSVAVGLSLLDHPAVAPARVGGRTEYAHDGLIEWWEEGPRGLEQGFDVADPPDGELVLEVGVTGAVAEVDEDGLGATLRPSAGPSLRYDHLAAWDERGTALPARMEATEAGVRLVVDATDAVGAVTIDPLVAVAAWSVESDVSYQHFGHAVASAGDVNGDGYDDLVVGTTDYGNGERLEGGAFLYLGSAAGLSAAPAWSAESNQAYAFFGQSVAGAGDVNGDGYEDVVVGAHGFDGGESDEG